MGFPSLYVFIIRHYWRKVKRKKQKVKIFLGQFPGSLAVWLVGLPPDKEAAVLAVDVHGQSCLQAAALLHVSVDGLAKIRRRAYAKIADDMQG